MLFSFGAFANSPTAAFEFFTEDTYSIGNYVWLDEDGDGDQDAGEPGIGGATIELSDDAGVVIATTITDFNGGYLFENLSVGTYSVSVVQPTLPAGLDNQTFDTDGTLDHTSTIILSSDNLKQDFGYNFVPPTATNSPTTSTLSAFGHRIWLDSNSNGHQDIGEAGIGGVTVKLFNQAGTHIGIKTSDAAGYYIYENIPAGVYSVEVDVTTLPAGLVTTPTGDPSGDMDSKSSQIVLAPGDVFLGLDFGYNNPTGSVIGDKIFLDTNADGVEDPTDLPVAGVTVALVDDVNENGSWDEGELPIATNITDQNGNYTFEGLIDGNYIVVITDSNNKTAGMTNSADPDGGLDETASVTIADADELNQAFGYTPDGHTTSTGLIGNFVFLDANGDNAFTTGENGIEGVKVELFDGSGTLKSTTKTIVNGQYLFGGLEADTYTIKVDPGTLPGAANTPAGLIQSVDPDGTFDNESTITIALAEINLDQNFGYKALASNLVGGTLWEDMDANGTADESSPVFFEAVTIVLRDDLGNSIGSTETDANGNYNFVGLPDGTYTVDVTDEEEVLNNYWKSDGSNVGSDNNSQPDGANAVTVFGGMTNTTSDFGYYTEGASIGNTVWMDRNGDGIQNADEVALPLATVTLTITYPDGTVLVLTTTTDANGHYSFDNLLLDEDYATGGGGTMPTYELTVAIPDGFENTEFSNIAFDPGRNGNDLEDANNPLGTLAIPTQGNNDVAQMSDPNNENLNASYDFGFVLDCSASAVQYAITNGAISNAGQTTDYFYEHAIQNMTTDEVHVPLVAQSGVTRCVDYCTFGDWNYYFNPSDPDEYLFAIRPGTNVTPIAYIELTVDDDPVDRYASGLGGATYVMARDWFVRTKNDGPLVDAAGDPTTVDIRFYFPEEEFKEIFDQAVAQANAWGSGVPTVADVYWFKKEAFDVDVVIEETGSELTPFNITGLQNAPTDELGRNTNDGAPGTVGNGKNHIQFNGIDGFSGGTAAITIDNIPLPIALTQFDVNMNDCNATLKWGSEVNFEAYRIERSLDGVNYETIKMIEPTTVNQQQFTYTDKDLQGDYFYRLKIYHVDGSYEYSIVQATERDCKGHGDLKVFPNPIEMSTTHLNVSFKTDVQTNGWITIQDALGRKFEKENIAVEPGTNTTQVAIQHLPPGTYVILLELEDATYLTKQFLKL